MTNKSTIRKHQGPIEGREPPDSARLAARSRPAPQPASQTASYLLARLPDRLPAPASQTASQPGPQLASQRLPQPASQPASQTCTVEARSPACTVEALHQTGGAPAPPHTHPGPPAHRTGHGPRAGHWSAPCALGPRPGSLYMNLQPHSEIATIASMHGTWRSAVVCLRKRSDRASFLPGSFRAAGG